MIGITNSLLEKFNKNLVKSYTVTESWEDGTNGNPIAIFNTVLSDIEHTSEECLIVVAKNNTAVTNALDVIVISHPETNNLWGGWIVRKGWTELRPISTTYSSYVSQGTTLEVYRMNIKEMFIN